MCISGIMKAIEYFMKQYSTYYPVLSNLQFDSFEY